MNLDIAAGAWRGRCASLGAPTRYLLASACLLCTASMTRAAIPGDIKLQGVINGSQNTAYVLVPFQVPAGTERLTVSFCYTGRRA